MKMIFAMLSTVVMLAGAAFGEVKHEKDAAAAAEKWLGGIDDGKYAQSWQDASAYFKGAVTEEVWKTKLEGVRKPLGKLVSRVLTGSTYAKALPGAPDGEYVVLKYETVFENKKDAVETVTPMMEKDGTWKVSGYLIK